MGRRRTASEIRRSTSGGASHSATSLRPRAMLGRRRQGCPQALNGVAIAVKVAPKCVVARSSRQTGVKCGPFRPNSTTPVRAGVSSSPESNGGAVTVHFLSDA